MITCGVRRLNAAQVAPGLCSADDVPKSSAGRMTAGLAQTVHANPIVLSQQSEQSHGNAELPLPSCCRREATARAAPLAGASLPEVGLTLLGGLEQGLGCFDGVEIGVEEHLALIPLLLLLLSEADDLLQDLDVIAFAFGFVEDLLFWPRSGL
jgi:hypothetical protein